MGTDHVFDDAKVQGETCFMAKNVFFVYKFEPRYKDAPLEGILITILVKFCRSACRRSPTKSCSEIKIFCNGLISRFECTYNLEDSVLMKIRHEGKG